MTQQPFSRTEVSQTIRGFTGVMFFLAVLLFCIGCNTSAPATSDSGLESRSLTELANLAMSEVEEIKFCLSEGAGVESLQESADRMQKVLKALPGSVSASGLPESKTEKLNNSIQSLTTAYDSLAGSLESQASSAEISKVNSKIHSEIKTLTKLLR